MPKVTEVLSSHIKSEKIMQLNLDIDVSELPLDSQLIIVKVGTEDRPASEEDINQVEEEIKALNLPCTFLVTHHAIEFKTVEDVIKESNKDKDD